MPMTAWKIPRWALPTTWLGVENGSLWVLGKPRWGVESCCLLYLLFMGWWFLQTSKSGPKALTAVFQLSGELDCFRKGFVQITLTVRKTHLLSEGEVNLASCYGWGQLLHDVIPQNGPWVYLAVDMCTPNTTLFSFHSCGCRCKP